MRCFCLGAAPGCQAEPLRLLLIAARMQQRRLLTVPPCMRSDVRTPTGPRMRWMAWCCTTCRSASAGAKPCRCRARPAGRRQGAWRLRGRAAQLCPRPLARRRTIATTTTTTRGTGAAGRGAKARRDEACSFPVCLGLPHMGEGMKLKGFSRLAGAQQASRVLARSGAVFVGPRSQGPQL